MLSDYKHLVHRFDLFSVEYNADGKMRLVEQTGIMTLQVNLFPPTVIFRVRDTQSFEVVIPYIGHHIIGVENGFKELKSRGFNVFSKMPGGSK